MTYADGRYGALDIGTVTCRLLVADVEDGRIIDVDKEYAITDLGVGVDATGRLSEAAIERVLACVDRYLEVLARYDAPEHPVRRLIAMATSASRDAENGPEFAARLAERGVTLAVIPGSREAQLTFLGASSDFPDEKLLVVDIGGGSTEVVAGSFGDRSGGLPLLRYRLPSRDGAVLPRRSADAGPDGRGPSVDSRGHGAVFRRLGRPSALPSIAWWPWPVRPRAS